MDFRSVGELSQNLSVNCLKTVPLSYIVGEFSEENCLVLGGQRVVSKWPLNGQAIRAAYTVIISIICDTISSLKKKVKEKFIFVKSNKDSF